MGNVRRISLDELVRHFEVLEDPRSTVNLQHPLTSVIVIAVIAVLAGANGPTAIADWVSFAVGLVFVLRTIRARGGWVEGVFRPSALLDVAAMRRLFDVNFNLMVRTWTLILGFTWFVNAGVSGMINGERQSLHRLVDALLFQVQPDRRLFADGLVNFEFEPRLEIMGG